MIYSLQTLGVYEDGVDEDGAEEMLNRIWFDSLHPYTESLTGLLTT